MNEDKEEHSRQREELCEGTKVGIAFKEHKEVV